MGHFFRSDDTTEAYTESKEEVGEEYSSTSQLEHTHTKSWQNSHASWGSK